MHRCRGPHRKAAVRNHLSQEPKSMKIAFTSCMDATHVPSQPIWNKIRADDPDVVLLLGDQIYMDIGIAGLKCGGWPKCV